MLRTQEVQKLIRRLLATLASTSTLSKKSCSAFSSTHFVSPPVSLALELANTHTTQRSRALHTISKSRRWQHAAPSSFYSSGADSATSATADNDKNNDSSADDMQQEVLNTALNLVKQLGWTRNALQTAATQLGLSPAIAGSFPRGAVHLVEAFNTRCNQKLREILLERTEELDDMDTKEKLALGVQLRLEMIHNYQDMWPDALALQAHPSEIAYSLQNYGTIADIIWRAAGDESVDFSWYTRRAALSGIYVATELFLLTDRSKDYSETWRFLKNRLKNIEEILKSI